MFGGGFLGSGESTKKVTTKTETNITTDTTTNIRDIGLTGQHAVDIANVTSANIGGTLTRIADSGADIMESGAGVLKEVAGTSEVLFQTTGNNYNQLIGGANELIKTGSKQTVDLAKQGTYLLGDLAETSERVIGKVQDRGIQFLSDLGVRQSEAQSELLTIQRDTTNPALSLAKGSQEIIMLAILGMAVFFIAKKG